MEDALEYPVFDQREIPNAQGGLVAADSRKGAKEHQEDSWVIFCSEDKTLTAAGIYDGHGLANGVYASRKCIEITWEWFQKNWKEMLTYSDEMWEKVLREFFHKLHESIRIVYTENEAKTRQASAKSSLEHASGSAAPPLCTSGVKNEKGKPVTSSRDSDDEKEKNGAVPVDKSQQPTNGGSNSHLESFSETKSIDQVQGNKHVLVQSASPIECIDNISRDDKRDEPSSDTKDDERKEQAAVVPKNVSNANESTTLPSIVTNDENKETGSSPLDEVPLPPVIDSRGIIRNKDGRPIHGGTTASLCIVINTKNVRRCICANVGDSDVLLLPFSQKVLPEVRKNFLHLSVSHGPDNPKEWERIHRLPKEDYPWKLIFIYDTAVSKKTKFDCPRVFQEYGPNAGAKEPEYVKDPWSFDFRPSNARYDPAVYAVSPKGAEDSTCIAMTRTLGDFYAHQLGLTWEPSVYITDLEPDMEYVISVGSDGIWDCWKFDDFSEYVTSTIQMYSNDLLRATTDIVRTTITRAKSLFGISSFDDASLCLVLVPKADRS